MKKIKIKVPKSLSHLDYLEEVVEGYKQAVIFTGCQPGDELEGNTVFAPEFEEEIWRDCIVFLLCVGKKMFAKYRVTCEAGQLGSDFWFTRNGHGTGFWDRDYVLEWMGCHLTTLTEENFREVDTFLDPEGLINGE